MPQMAPLSWLFYTPLFVMLIIILSCFIFFVHQPTPNLTFSFHKSSPMNWKW